VIIDGSPGCQSRKIIDFRPREVTTRPVPASYCIAHRFQTTFDPTYRIYLIMISIIYSHTRSTTGAQSSRYLGQGLSAETSLQHSRSLDSSVAREKSEARERAKTTKRRSSSKGKGHSKKSGNYFSSGFPQAPRALPKKLEPIEGMMNVLPRLRG